MAAEMDLGASKYFIGIDGGKSKTLCVLARADGQVLGVGRSGSSDPYARPFEDALDEVGLAVRRACAAARVPVESVGWGVFGLAGADWPEDFERLRAGLEKRRLSRGVLVKNDMHVALRANVLEGAGVLVSAGTHLAAAIRLDDGFEWHSGWFSVDGLGGLQAGQRLFWAVMRSLDGRGPATRLTQLLLQFTGYTDPIDLLREHSAGRLDDAFFAALTPLIFQAYAETQDGAAEAIITDIGVEISLWAAGLLERFGLADRAVPVALSGGLMKAGEPLLLNTVIQRVQRRCPRAVIQPARREPVLGALIDALRAGDVQVTPGLLSRMDAEFAARSVRYAAA